MFIWCKIYSLLVGLSPEFKAPIKEGRLAGQHLTGEGLPSLKRAVANQWDAMIPPTFEGNP